MHGVVVDMNDTDHQEVFSLHDEDLGFCDKIKAYNSNDIRQTCLLTALHTIPPQLLEESACKHLDTWLRQGIIRPSQSPYTSQVVIV